MGSYQPEICSLSGHISIYLHISDFIPARNNFSEAHLYSSYNSISYSKSIICLPLCFTSMSSLSQSQAIPDFTHNHSSNTIRDFLLSFSIVCHNLRSTSFSLTFRRHTLQHFPYIHSPYIRSLHSIVFCGYHSRTRSSLSHVMKVSSQLYSVR